MSETIGVEVQYKDIDLLRKVVESLGGKWIGQGEHRLYSSSETGIGFQLPKWTYPCILQNGTLKYDNYHGIWGDASVLSQVNTEYTLQMAEQTAQQNGFIYERVSNAVKVLQGEQREVWIFADGRVEAVGFNGVGCHEACNTFAEALGQIGTITAKPEYNFNELNHRVQE